MPNVRSPFAQFRPGEHGDWYRIENKAKTKTARVDLFDAIGGWYGVEAKDFVKDLNALDVETIELHINSPGGDVFDGIAIYNALVDHKATVNVTVDGIAASAASFIAMAGEEITMNRAATLMIHDAQGLSWGNASDMEDMATLLNRFSDEIAGIYADRTGSDVADWREAMRAETWFSADEAIEAGLATKVAAKRSGDDGEAATNRFDLSIFNHAGRDDAPAPFIATKKKKTRDTVTNEQPQENRSMTPDQLKAIGLAEDASEETITDRLATLVNQADTPDTGDDKPKDDDEETSDVEEAEEETEVEVTPPVEVPEGTVLVDKAQWHELQNKLNTLVMNSAQREKEDKAKRKDDFITAALKDGKFKARDRKHYENIYDASEDAARSLINALEPNVVPMEEIGRGSDDGDPTRAEDAYPAEWSNLLQVKEVNV